jgi:hypothetical protein
VNKAGGKTVIRERFACEEICQQQRPGRDAEWLDEKRSERACTLIDAPLVVARLVHKTIHSGGWMGRAALPGSTPPPPGVQRWATSHPTEDATEGCPGGWYRSLFVASIYPYLRRRDDHGNRVANLLLDRCDDDLVLQLVQYAEDEQERYKGWEAEQMAT